jgi:hypothetical protein
VRAEQASRRRRSGRRRIEPNGSVAAEADAQGGPASSVVSAMPSLSSSSSPSPRDGYPLSNLSELTSVVGEGPPRGESISSVVVRWSQLGT